MTPTVGSRLAFVVAAVLIAVGDALYVTDLSRSTGVVVLAVSIAFVGLGTLTLWRGKWPARGWLIAVALALAVLLALGTFTLIYSALHRPVSSYGAPDRAPRRDEQTLNVCQNTPSGTYARTAGS